MRFDRQADSVWIHLPSGEIGQSNIPEVRRRSDEAYERKYTYRLEDDVEVVSYNPVAYAAAERAQLWTITRGNVAAAVKDTRAGGG